VKKSGSLAMVRNQNAYCLSVDSISLAISVQRFVLQSVMKIVN